MTDITPLVPEDRKVVTAYGGGGFRISGERWAQSVIVFPGRVVAWPVTAMAGLGLDALAPVVEAAEEVEILLIGSGREVPVIGDGLRGALREMGISTDVMDTGAACRTYNILLSEARLVAAAMIAVE